MFTADNEPKNSYYSEKRKAIGNAKGIAFVGYPLVNLTTMKTVVMENYLKIIYLLNQLLKTFF